MAHFSENADKIRGRHLSEGISSLKSKIRDVQIVSEDCVPTHKKKAKKKYTQEETADRMVDLYKENIKLPTHPVNDPKKEQVKADTVASRANIRALSNSLANIRNGGYAGPTTEFTPSANGDVNPGRPRGYNALVVAGTEMTLEDYKKEIETRMEACWKGYKRKPGTVEGAKGSCVKEEEVVESDVVDELKDELVEMDDHSWQSIDKVMRRLAKENDITPKELHKQFKAESNGMIPDDWAKKYAVREEAGYMPLDEAATLYKTGNVYDVSLMWRAHTRRLKFFWPELGSPTRDDMQRAVDMFYPGGKLLSYYISTEPGDNQTNFIVVVPPLRESVWLPQDAWEEMSDELTAKYEYVLAEEGEPTSPPMWAEDGTVTVWVEDHDTGEEKVVVLSEKEEGKKDACYKKVKSRYAVWPSAYASGALVKCRQKGADNWGKSDKKEEYIPEDMSGMSQKSGDKRSTESGAGMTAKGVAKYNARTGGDLKTAVTTPPSKLKPGSKAANRRKSFCARSRGWNGERGKAARKRWNC